ncbi:hypothetical protein ANK1_4085 [plant metagenome]|uniref:Uncharacterized protein n=1 Tax=plant metagenome TaxID=1297885 RepID=A0A484Q0Q7_9ZZZZ
MLADRHVAACHDVPRQPANVAPVADDDQRVAEADDAKCRECRSAAEAEERT